MIGRARYGGLLALWAVGCQALPEVEHETDHLRLATDFDAPVCAGTLRMLDRAAGRIEASLGTTSGDDDPYMVFWLEHELDEHCDADASGCFYPSTRIAFARGESIAHELVHATIDSPGRAYFVEEGLAELFGGAAVRHDPDELRGELGSQLRLSQHDYQHGRLSYDQAAHFAHWVREAEGEGALRRLAAALEQEDGEAEVREQLEGIFGTSLRGIEQHYGREAPRTYRGLYDDRLDSERLEDHALWLSVSLDCDDEDVVGPLRGAEEGMVRQIRLEVPQRRTARLRMDGGSGTWVELVEPYAGGRLALPPWSPSLDEDGRLARLEPGGQATVDLRSGSYLLVFGARTTVSSTIDLQILR